MILFTQDHCKECAALIEDLGPSLIEELALDVLALPATGASPTTMGINALAEADFYNVTLTPCLVMSRSAGVVGKDNILKVLKKGESNVDEHGAGEECKGESASGGEE